MKRADRETRPLAKATSGCSRQAVFHHCVTPDFIAMDLLGKKPLRRLCPWGRRTTRFSQPSSRASLEERRTLAHSPCPRPPLRRKRSSAVAQKKQSFPLSHTLENSSSQSPAISSFIQATRLNDKSHVFEERIRVYVPFCKTFCIQYGLLLL